MKQLFRREPSRGQALCVMSLQERLQRRTVGLEAVGPEVVTHQLANPAKVFVHQRQRHLGRGRIVERLERGAPRSLERLGQRSWQERMALDQRLAELSGVGESKTPGVNPEAVQLVAKLEARLRNARDEMLPLTLVAPISGIVHSVLRQNGEAVVEGEPLVFLNSPQADRIVAFVRQPYSFTPRIGLPVEIVTRNPPRQRFLTQVNQVGAQLEAITNSLAVLVPGKLVDAGLQIVLPLPPELTIRPGEIVDVHVKGSSVANFFQRPTKLEATTRPQIQ